MDYRSIISFLQKMNQGLILCVFLCISTPVFAGDLPVPAPLGLPFEVSGPTTTENATSPVVKIIKETIKYVGLLAILAISWGGIQFLVSYGSDEKVKKAKQTIIYALVGVVLSVFAYAIVDLVNSITVIPR